MVDEMKEKLDASAQEVSNDDRRDFLKNAARAAGTLGVASALGLLAESEASAADPVATPNVPNLAQGQLVGGSQLRLAKAANRKQFGLVGGDLGKVLQAEGFIPSSVKNIEKAALHVSVSW